jgi:hypothetical protein
MLPGKHKIEGLLPVASHANAVSQVLALKRAQGQIHIFGLVFDQQISIASPNIRLLSPPAPSRAVAEGRMSSGTMTDIAAGDALYRA